MNVEMVIETRDNEPELINEKTWRTRKGLMGVMTGRTWHYHGIGSQSQENADARSAEVLAGLHIG